MVVVFTNVYDFVPFNPCNFSLVSLIFTKIITYSYPTSCLSFLIFKFLVIGGFLSSYNHPSSFPWSLGRSIQQI